MKKRTLYDVLEVEQNATPDEIKAAITKLRGTYHGKDDQMVYTHASETLADEGKRYQYDIKIGIKKRETASLLVVIPSLIFLAVVSAFIYRPWEWKIFHAPTVADDGIVPTPYSKSDEARSLCLSTIGSNLREVGKAPDQGYQDVFLFTWNRGLYDDFTKVSATCAGRYGPPMKISTLVVNGRSVITTPVSP